MSDTDPPDIFAGLDLPIYHVRTTLEQHRPAAGSAESLVTNVPAWLYVDLPDGGGKALNVRALGALIRPASEKGALSVGEELHHASWVITSDPAVVDQLGMHGDPTCRRCREGTDEALRLLAAGTYPELLVGVLYYAGEAT